MIDLINDLGTIAKSGLEDLQAGAHDWTVCCWIPFGLFSDKKVVVISKHNEDEQYASKSSLEDPSQFVQIVVNPLAWVPKLSFISKNTRQNS